MVGIYVFLSPAKNLAVDPVAGVPMTVPAFQKEAVHRARGLARWSVGQWANHMKVSQAIAQQNIGWLRHWEQSDVFPAAALYAGEAFKMLNARAWNADQWQYASEHLWIGSGMYGLLRATDGIRPYRLEMDVRLPGELQRLSAQWSSILTQFVDQTLPKDAVILQLMSDEYARSVQWEALNRPVYAVDFQERTPDGYRSVAVFLKKARGLLADFVIRHQLEDVDQIRAFSGNRYGFVENSLVNNTILFNQF